jgi:hypothetical protein
MLGKRPDEAIELECPICGVKVKASSEEAERGKVRCPRGHEFAVMGMLAGSGRDAGDGPAHQK